MEEETLEILDFTLVSELERIVSSFEQVLIAKKDEHFPLSDFDFRLCFYEFKIINKPFPLVEISSPEDLIRQATLLSSFIVFSHVTEQITDISSSKLILSAAINAVNQKDSETPIFIPLGNTARGMHLGYFRCRESSLHYRINMLYLTSIPLFYSDLESIIKMFYERYECYSILPKIQFRETYISNIPDSSPDSLFKKSPLKSITLLAEYIQQEIKQKTEFPIQNVFDILTKWTIVTKFYTQSSEPSVWTNDSFKTAFILYSFVCYYYDTSTSNPRPSTPLKDIKTSPKNSKQKEGTVLFFINRTKDDDLESLQQSKMKFLVDSLFNDNPFSSQNLPFDYKLSSNMFIPRNSFLWNMCKLISSNYQDSWSSNDIIHLFKSVWQACLVQFKSCWEKGHFIPNVHSDFSINLKSSLLHQKLCMLNACIDRKIQKGGYKIKKKRGKSKFLSEKYLSKVPKDNDASWHYYSSSEWSANEADENISDFEISIPLEKSTLEDNELVQEIITVHSNVEKQLKDAISTSIVSEGRKKESALKLLSHNDEPLWIPETQDTGVMTEDMINEQNQLFEIIQEDSKSEENQLHKTIQNSQLLSDMEAFKAANPLGLIEDFVRWHSPKDWKPSDDGLGELSSRMTVPGNLWQDLWKKARPLSIDRQKSLFNYEKEGARVIQDLENLSEHEVIHNFLGTIIGILYESMDFGCMKVLFFQKQMEKLANSITAIKWESPPLILMDSLQNLVQGFKFSESKFLQTKSLLEQFPEKYEFVSRLLVGPFEIGYEDRGLVLPLFITDSGLSKPVIREYVIETELERKGNVEFMLGDELGLPEKEESLLRMYINVNSSMKEVKIVEMKGTLEL